MFGNLFNPKRAAQQEEIQGTPSQPVTQPLPPQQVRETPVQAEEGKLISSTMTPGMRQNVAALSRLDTRANQVLHHAEKETERIRQSLIEPEQVLFGLLYDGEIFRLIENFGVDVAKLSREIQSKETQGTFVGQPTLSKDTQRIFDEAYGITKNRSASFISPEDLLLALFSEASAADLLQTQGVQREQVEEKLSKTTGYTLGKKTVLDKYGIDLTDQAKEGLLDPVAGRDREIERAIHILLRRTKNNPIIIGEAGVGKTAIVEALAQKIVAGAVPEALRDKRIIQLDLASLVAGASHRGEFEERLKNVIKEVQLSEGKILLFIDEIHAIVGAGDTQGALDASNIIKPYLARGQLQVIGTTTTAEYRKYFEKDKAFERRFQPILCDEPEIEVAIQMLEVLKPKYENFHKVVVGKEALEAAVKLSKKYIGERYLPDKAVDLLDEAAAEVKLQHAEGKRQDNNVTKSDIEKVVSAWTGIPITKLTEDESEKLLNMEKLIHARLIDQEEAVAAVAEAVRRGRIGLAAANRPIASFIFLGPTGVGKTELAKTLAEIMFGKEDAMVRLDMSEYMEKHEVAKFIGAPPGYVGYEEGGHLTEAVRIKPYSIVLLDEVEKAHPDVFNILLQVLEDGRLTDNKGNTISFKNTIIIATSNIGSALIQQQLSQKEAKTEEELTKQFSELSQVVMAELHKFFRPELLNRFDEVVIFKPLGRKDMHSIAKLGIEKTKKLLSEQGFGLDITEKALALLAQEGYDPVYGARPLRRLIQTAIENPIALLIIGKTFVQKDIILIDYDEKKEEFTFTKAAPAQASSEQQQPQGSQPTQNPEQPEPMPPGGQPPSQPPIPPPPPSQLPQEPQLVQGEVLPPPQPIMPPPPPEVPDSPPPPFSQGAAIGASLDQAA